MDLLGLPETVSYRRLRSLADLLRAVSPTQGVAAWTVEGTGKHHVWARFRMDDIARLVVIVDVCGGTTALGVGDDASSRLRGQKGLVDACAALRSSPFSFRDPLLEVPLLRIGRRVAAYVDGQFVFPDSQQSIAFVGGQGTSKFIHDLLSREPRLKPLLRTAMQLP